MKRLDKTIDFYKHRYRSGMYRLVAFVPEVLFRLSMFFCTKLHAYKLSKPVHFNGSCNSNISSQASQLGALQTSSNTLGNVPLGDKSPGSLPKLQFVKQLMFDRVITTPLGWFGWHNVSSL